MKYIIIGIPGVGKSAVIEKVIEKTGIKRVNWGDMMADYLVEKKIVKDRDEMRKLSIREQSKYQKIVAGDVTKLTMENEDLFIETHAVIKTPRGYWPGLSYEIIKQIDPDVFIVIEADAKDIMSRRMNDKTRVRKDDLTLEDIEEHIRITREMVTTYTILSSGTACFVENKEGDVDYAVGKILALMGR
jgi:adenylate kinase